MFCLSSKMFRFRFGSKSASQRPLEVVRNFVRAELGEHYTVSPDFDLVGCFKDHGVVRTGGIRLIYSILYCTYNCLDKRSFYYRLF